ncbi:hypothetical protein Sgly_1618 [Syntrophobotulus glycolicus DSM 8271]|uniref:Paeninodin family lasso peptide n=1 Tax=Syntrophobotulus glycolicus (strain DSM 8271 / FlGlyR) TaxID=645991 RepID=F0SY81_SYNGF|nr:hypothetical protein [Syntrophobotulus glycolicus]ADY55916.1 hypothetical protein Sgly_1618 [Syntrophobotulus glycolicus DSM 8271]
MKKEWNNPTITSLSLDKTMLGTEPNGNIDDSFPYNGHTYYSFS